MRILEDLAKLRLRRISLTRRVGCWSPVPILDAVLNTGDLQERRVDFRDRGQERWRPALAGSGCVTYVRTR